MLRDTHASRLCVLPPTAPAVRPAKKAPPKAARGHKALLVDSDEEEEGELRASCVSACSHVTCMYDACAQHVHACIPFCTVPGIHGCSAYCMYGSHNPIGP